MGYEWYEEDLTAFILKYDLPAYNREYEIKKFYSLQAKQFLEDFDIMFTKRKNRSHTDEFYNQILEAKRDIRKAFTFISKALSAYDALDFKKAQEIFDIMMGTIWPKLFITSINGLFRYDPRLFRIRAVTQGQKLKKPLDLFHIPYNKRNLITNERYSLSGHPCLYLATYLGIAWEECGYPSQFYYSEFKFNYDKDFNNDWKFITLISSRTFANTFLIAMNPDKEDILLQWIIRYLTTYPLILACSVVNLNGNSVFKPEYVIPQMLLQWVQRNYGKVHGITYFSCVATDNLRRLNGYDIVIPANNIDRRGYGKNLIEKFQVSKPIFCDNLLPVKDATIISNFKNDLLRNFDIFPHAAMDCITMMYEICQSFNTIVTHTKETKMELIVSSVQSVKRNCSCFLSRYNKAEIVTASEKEDYLGNIKARIENFCIYYNRFRTEVKSVIDKYDLDLTMITVPQESNFYKI